jgi:hypothetical protein
MSEPGARPGGLTALAVFNFVFAVLQFFSAATSLTAPILMPLAIEQAERAKAAETRAADSEPVETREQPSTQDKSLEDMKKANQLIQANRPLMFLSGGIEGVLGVLLVISGIGYLKQRQAMGRRLGTFYALVEIVWGVAAGFYVNQVMHQEFSLWSVIGFIYPVVTLLCLQVIFKHDFPNP